MQLLARVWELLKVSGGPRARTVNLIVAVCQPKIGALSIGVLAGIGEMVQFYGSEFSEPFWFEASGNLEL